MSWLNRKLAINPIPQAMLKDFQLTYNFSPDALEVQKKIAWWVFFYDSYMIGRRDYSKIKNELDYKPATAFTEERFTLWKKTRHKFEAPYPIAIEDFDPRDKTIWDPSDISTKMKHRAQIKGELHLLSTEQILELDTTKLNGIEWQRTKVKVEIPYVVSREDVNRSMNKFTTRECWMYVGRREYWDRLIDAGFEFQRVNIYNGRPELAPYYAWTKLEDDE